jgi:hypothetical protein
MVAAARFAPLLWSNTSVLPGTAGNTSFALLPTGEAAPVHTALHGRQNLYGWILRGCMLNQESIPRACPCSPDGAATAPKVPAAAAARHER